MCRRQHFNECNGARINVDDMPDFAPPKPAPKVVDDPRAFLSGKRGGTHPVDADDAAAASRANRGATACSRQPLLSHCLVLVVQVLLNGIGNVLLRVGARNTLHPARKRCAIVVVVGCWLIMASQFVAREPEDERQAAGELLHSLLYRWGNYVRNNDTPNVLNFINVECLAFTLGIGLDSW